MKGGGLKIDKIELTPNQIALVIDETPKAQLNAKILDEEGKEMSADKITLEWTIDSESVASISQDGEVTAVGEGNAIITVQIKGEEGRTRADSLVNEAFAQPYHHQCRP